MSTTLSPRDPENVHLCERHAAQGPRTDVRMGGRARSGDDQATSPCTCQTSGPKIS